MQKTEFPEVKERMETKLCCAHNATRGCSVSSRVGVVDLAQQPLKALKMLMDGLATDGTSCLWLRSLLGPPRMMHLFPFDFVYLDEDLRILEAIELFPNMPFPSYQAAAASALIMPIGTLASTGTQKGDQFILCEPEELESRLAGIAIPHVPEPVAVSPPVEPAESLQLPHFVDALPNPAPIPTISPNPDHRIPVQTSTVSPATGFTVSVATTWQLTGNTMPPAVLPETTEEAAEPAPTTLVADPEPENAPPSTRPDPQSTPGNPVAPNVTHHAPAEPTGSSPSSSMDPPKTLLLQPEPLSDPTGHQLLDAIAIAEAAETLAPLKLNPAAPEEPDQRIARSREAWEKTQVKPAQVTAPRTIKIRKKPIEQKKDPLGTRVIRWLNLEDPPPERRKIIRLRLEGLHAWEVNGDHTKRYEMRDVCPTGFCLRTQCRWQPGQLLSLVIERNGSTEHEHENRVRIQARVVRCEDDGVGLVFVFPKGTEFQPWKRVKTKRSDETEAAYILRELRFSTALGLLRRLCPGAAEEVRHAFHERLSNKRVASAVDIVLMAEEIMSRDGQIDLARAHTDMIMRIVEGGSWVEDAWIRKLWAGLLVSSCSADGQDTSNHPFIDMLAKLTPLHLRILSFVCGRATEAIAAGQTAKDFYLECTSEELMAASDSHSFARIQQTIGHLATYGLLAERARPSYVTLSDKAKTRMAPTALGLKMWARCNGQRV